MPYLYIFNALPLHIQCPTSTYPMPYLYIFNTYLYTFNALLLHIQCPTSTYSMPYLYIFNTYLYIFNALPLYIQCPTSTHSNGKVYYPSIINDSTFPGANYELACCWEVEQDVCCNSSEHWDTWTDTRGLTHRQINTQNASNPRPDLIRLTQHVTMSFWLFINTDDGMS